MLHSLDFLLAIPKHGGDGSFKISGELEKMRELEQINSPTMFVADESKLLKLRWGKDNLIIGGDPIGIETIGRRSSGPGDRFDMPEFLHSVAGHYYAVHLGGNEGDISVSSSLFSIFPIFWYEDTRFTLVSSSVSLIAALPGVKATINRQFILQQMLFNYPLFNDTLYQEIKLLPSNHAIRYYQGELTFLKHTEIADYYTDNPRPWRQSSSDLTDLFLQTYERYIPKSKANISFTGGFDGRTLVACAQHFGQDFGAFSFGTRINEDVLIPLKQSRSLGIPFKPIYLDEETYVRKAYYENGKELIHLSSDYSNFLYVHFLHSAKLLSEDAPYLFTGYFGSELFRAFHITGAMVPRELFSFMAERDENKWIQRVTSSPKLAYINLQMFRKELDELIETLSAYRKSLLSSTESPSQRFHTLVMEEILRKFFGPIIFAQFNYLTVRTPFLDNTFVKELFLTELAGVNNEFFTQNPVKRLRGQYLYATVINRTYPGLGQLPTQKGYRPIDLLSFPGNLRIVYPFFHKRVRRNIGKPNLDNLSIISGLKHAWSNLKGTRWVSEYYNLERISQAVENLDSSTEEVRDLVALSFSTSEYLKGHLNAGT